MRELNKKLCDWTLPLRDTNRYKQRKKTFRRPQSRCTEALYYMTSLDSKYESKHRGEIQSLGAARVFDDEPRDTP